MATRPEVFVPQAAPLTQERRGALATFWKRWGVYYLFMAPFLTVFTVFVIAPVLVAMYLSFTYFNVLEPPRWIGWSNYKLLFLEDAIFDINKELAKKQEEFGVKVDPSMYRRGG